MAERPVRPEKVTPVSLGSLSQSLRLRHVSGDAGVSVTGIALSSSAVLPGDLFVGLPGRNQHGASFAASAVEAGAVAILTDEAGAGMVQADVPVLVHEFPREILGRLARTIYDQGVPLPRVFAVTGTNGKTSVTFYLEAIARALGQRTALSNSAERRVAGEVFHTPLTTPEAPELQALLAIAASRGVTSFALEASAQAIERHRLDGIVAEVAGFTNLSHDHFEDYGGMEAYLAEKMRLFQPAMSSRAVVSLESEWGASVVRQSGVPVVTLGAEGEGEADWTFCVTHSDARGEQFTLSGPGGHLATSISACGLHMVRNAALAIVMTIESGVSPDQLRVIDPAHGGIDVVVPGRIERVSGGSPLSVFVDAGRSADAYENTFSTLRERNTGRLIVVCGTSGNRDRSKRPVMGEIAARMADVVFITDDDPRREDPQQIRSDLLEGARRVSESDIREVPHPSEAIRAAVREGRSGDAIVWMGPGSQYYREIQGERLPYSARDEARAALREAGWLTE